MNIVKSSALIGKIFPALIVFLLWLDGWFYPLLLLPFLYVTVVEKKGLDFLGFRREKLDMSVLLGLGVVAVLVLVYLPIFFYYRTGSPLGTLMSLYIIFTDVLWYPLYEEVAYRGFFLSHFIGPNDSYFSAKELLLNLSQAMLFLSIHHKYVTLGQPLILIPVFMLGFLNGLMFLKTRNLIGCIFSHSIINCIALLLNEIMI